MLDLAQATNDELVVLAELKYVVDIKKPSCAHRYLFPSHHHSDSRESAREANQANSCVVVVVFGGFLNHSQTPECQSTLQVYSTPLTVYFLEAMQPESLSQAFPSRPRSP